MQRPFNIALILLCISLAMLGSFLYYHYYHVPVYCAIADSLHMIGDRVENDDIQVATEHYENSAPFFVGELSEADDTDGDEDSVISDEDNDFLVVNRSSDYLLEGAISFYKDCNMHTSIVRLTEAWEPYNEWQLRQLHMHSQQLRKKKNVSKKRTRLKTSTKKLIASRVQPIKARFGWPIDPASFWLSSAYGPRKHKDGSPGFHHGIDMAAPRGTKVKAAAKGCVVSAGYTAGWGNNILLDHLDGRFKTRYAHLDKIRVYVGQYVNKESWIGDVGSTGRVRKKGKDASHLHFEVYDYGKRVNPMLYIEW